VSGVRSGALAILVTAICAGFIAEASESGPVPARTGGFGEASCTQCHWDNPLDDPAGRLVVSGIPAAYAPGQRYTITVAVSHPQLVRAGFQVSARFEDGRNAGSLTPTDERTTVSVDPERSVTYAQHTAAGAVAPSPGAARWTFDWTAPPVAGDVVFHAAANAGNGDASPLGDFIYSRTERTRGQ
jgi:hypothetical protein